MNKKIFLLSIMLLSITGCSNFLSSTTMSVNRFLNYTDTGVNKPDDFPILRATGYAVISSQTGKNISQKSIHAMRASKLEAYKELTEQVYGLYIKSNSAVNDTKETYSKVSSEVSGVIHGARVIRQYPIGDTYVTELELDTKLIYDLYQMRGAL